MLYHLNQDSYKIADTVVITLEDQDLNVDVDTLDIFTVVTTPVLIRAFDGKSPLPDNSRLEFW